MKKYFVILLLCFSASPFVNAQFLKFGVKAGVNFANFNGGSLQGIDFSTLTSYHGGLVLKAKLLENFASIGIFILYPRRQIKWTRYASKK